MRYPTTSGGFVDVPDGCPLMRAPVVVTRAESPPADGFFLTGGQLLAHDDGWSVYSCSGLLVRVGEDAPTQDAAFRVEEHAA